MIARVLILVLLFFASDVLAQNAGPEPTVQDGAPKSARKADELLKHLSAAETYQIAGDLPNAEIENKAIVGIALQRLGNAAAEEGRLKDSAAFLEDSISYRDVPSARLDLALTYLQLGRSENAVDEAKAAVDADPSSIYSRYILGNIYFNREDYQAALPELEKVFRATPTFEVARALGLTYLNLKQVERAKLLFEEIQIAAKKESADLHIMFARDYEKTNYPLESERELRRALEIDPKRPRANFFLGYLILQNSGSERMQEAGKYFEKELELNPNDFYANFFAGVVASSVVDHPKAMKFLTKALELNPNSGEAWLFLAQSQLALGQQAEAEKSLRRAVALEANDKKKTQARRTHFLLGRLLLRTGRKEEGEKELAIAAKLQQESLNTARDDIKRILGQVVDDSDDQAPLKLGSNAKQDLTPERTAELKRVKDYLTQILAQAFHNLGVIAAQRKDYKQSLKNFALAAKYDPAFPGLDRNWGIISFNAGEYGSAIGPLGRSLTAKPQDVLIRQMLGTSYYFEGKFAEAVKTLEPLGAAIESNAELAYFYGISLVRVKRNSEAESLFSRLAKASQGNAEALSYAAQGFMIIGDYESAVREFNKVLVIAPDTPKVNYFLGQNLIRLNKYDEAEKHFRRELQLNPADYVSKYHLALTLIERKERSDEAVSLLTEALKQKPDYADAHYQLGKISLEKGDVQAAIAQLEAAATSAPDKDYIRYQLSIAYRRASRKADADRELELYKELKAKNRSNDSPMGNGERNR